MSLDPLWLRVFRDVGGDRYVSHAELPGELSAGRSLWDTYDRMFGRFTGAALDPLLFRFAHPGLQMAMPILPAGVPVLIVGTGPSLDAGCDELRRVRSRVLVTASLRAAVALQARGFHADLILVEHQTPFDAEGSADAQRHQSAQRFHPDTAVLADPATPPDLLRHLDPDMCRLAHHLPTWGLWPATLAALALDAGAPMVGLLGIDLGADGQVDPPHRPLVAVLEQLANASGICRDCGHSGAPKKGWARVSLAALAGTATGGLRRVNWRDERSSGIAIDHGRADLAALQPLLPDARAALAMALQARAGNVPPIRDLTQAIDLMLAWGTDPRLRWVLQRGLGLSFLPRFWRTGVSVGQPRQLWRPLVLALHELTTQADRLAGRLDEASGNTGRSGVARTGSQGASRPSDAGSRVAVDTPDPTVHATRISVLLPVKNGLPHLHEAVASLAGQTHPDIEIIVIDDGSDDGGPQEVLGQALSHVRVIRSNGQGVAAALNTGLRAATGAFIARHDADDWSHPERLARQFQYLLRHPDIDVLATNADLVDADGRAMDTPTSGQTARVYDDVQQPEAVASVLPIANPLISGTILARREILRAAGGYRAGFVGAEDYDLWLRLLPGARFAKLPTRLYAYRVHPRQTSQQFEDVARESSARARAEFRRRQPPDSPQDVGGAKDSDAEDPDEEECA